ncbi:MAG TPA: hypothetical protein VMH91_02940 [Candidatus Paceibacterota bacterium]|nr:hypothetical protein [Candidatus Paceibacterota bacterium]
MAQKRWLLLSSIAGVIALIFYLVNLLSPGTHLVFVGLLAHLIYLSGFAILGSKIRSDLLRYSACASVGIYVVSLLFLPNWLPVVLGLALSAATVGIGYPILTHKDHFGALGVWYGSLELLAATGVLYFFYASYPSLPSLLDAVLYILGSTLLIRESIRRSGK